jgi:hypothetical protein
MMIPMLKVMGNSRKALDWYLVDLVDQYKAVGGGGGCKGGVETNRNALLLPNSLANPASRVNCETGNGICQAGALTWSSIPLRSRWSCRPWI